MTSLADSILAETEARCAARAAREAGDYAAASCAMADQLLARIEGRAAARYEMHRATVTAWIAAAIEGGV